MSVETSETPQQMRSRISLSLINETQILMAPPKRNAGEWADANRVLPPESPEPGPWRTDRAPFWRDIYQAFADDQYDTIVVVCGAQMGKTEAIFNILGHRFTDGPYVPAIYVGPTEKQVRSISKDRIDKMLRSTPVLWDRTEKGQRYTVYEKWIAGVRMGFAWAGSATELASHPAGIILVDERDRMESDSGNEGDPVSLARARAKNYQFRKIGVFSTPTVENASPVWALMEEGTMHFWSWHCLGCGQRFVPRLDLLKWPTGSTPDEAYAAATVNCPTCGYAHTSRDQPRLNADGRYTRHRKIREGDPSDRAVFGKYLPDADARPKRTASFWTSGLASPWVAFGELAKVLIEAYRSGEQERIQAEINTGGGELYRMSGDAPAWEEVSGRRIEYPPRSIPWGVQKLSMGADVQKDGIFYVIRGWGYNSESWLIEENFLAGETQHDTVWAQLRSVIDAPIGQLRIERAFIDSGYRPGDVHRRPDHAVYTFCRGMPGVAYPTKGQDSMDQPYRYSNIDYTYGGAVVKNGVRLFHINTDYFKRWIHGRIRWPEGQTGGWHLHHATTEDYCKQIVSEELVLKASGKATWVRKSRNNHFLDCEVNATAAATSINVHRLQPMQNAVAAPATSQQREPARAQSGYERRGL